MKLIYIKKKTILLFLFLIILLLLFIGFVYKGSRINEVSYMPVSKKIIGIDPGHGGKDPGALGENGIYEKTINLDIALKLKRFIEQDGGKVVMTRKTDKNLEEKKNEDLKKRKEIIEKAACHIFVSIHMNSFTDPQYYGAQTFYMEGSQESQELAEIIQEEFRNILDEENKREASNREDVYILKELNIPSVLVEGGFLSNAMEASLLQTPEYQEKIAWAIYLGITKYFGDLRL